ncbi:MAG TPA: hypothetical protein VKA94_16055 [Hyphomicrobiales bacterium]|nr:hypothetical protein [Hyphomicrobiales bacterium]
MPNSDELNAAVDAGVIGRADADRLAAFLAQYRSGPNGAARPFAAIDDDAESVRFVRGFHDIFLSIGVILLLLGIGYSTNIAQDGYWFATTAIAAWALAEYFTRIKRLTLPSIVLSLAFGIAGGFAVNVLVHMIGGITPPENASDPGYYRTEQLLGAASALAASVVFFLRFRLPFTLAQIVVTTAFVVGTLLLLNAPDQSSIYKSPIFLVMGLLVFLVAVHFDLRDPERKTILADNAFWLHLTAAPLIVHIGVGFVWGSSVSSLTVQDSLTIMVLIAIVAFIALLIDRRAMLVAGLFYFGAALFTLIRNTAIEEGSVFAITLLILGASLLLLGVGWRQTRHFILTKLMPQNLARHLPTLRQA